MNHKNSPGEAPFVLLRRDFQDILSAELSVQHLVYVCKMPQRTFKKLTIWIISGEGNKATRGGMGRLFIVYRLNQFMNYSCKIFF